MKKLLIIILLLTSVGYSQTKFGVSGSNAFIGDLVYPIVEATLFSYADTSYNWTPYNTFLNATNDSIILFVNRGGSFMQFRVTSPIANGTTFFNRQTVTFDTGSSNTPHYHNYVDIAITPISAGLYRAFDHYLPSGVDYYYYLRTKSTNYGITWSPDSVSGYRDTASFGVETSIANRRVGEDATTFYNPDSSKFFVYFRDSTTQPVGGYPSNQYPLRSIALSKTTDMIAFTSRTVVIPTASSRPNFHKTTSKDYRVVWNNMSVVRTAPNEYFGFANVIKQNNSATENQEFPTGTDDIVQTRLYYSTDGTTWACLNDSNAFIPVHDTIKQIFSIPVLSPVQNDTNVFIYTIENNIRHNSNVNYVNNFTFNTGLRNKWYIRKYIISVANLRRFKP